MEIIINSELLTVKVFLSARTPKDLVKMQVKNNIKHGITFKYEIMFDGKLWYAWYLTSIPVEMRRSNDAS